MVRVENRIGVVKMKKKWYEYYSAHIVNEHMNANTYMYKVYTYYSKIVIKYENHRLFSKLSINTKLATMYLVLQHVVDCVQYDYFTAHSRSS